VGESAVLGNNKNIMLPLNYDYEEMSCMLHVDHSYKIPLFFVHHLTT